MNRPTKKGDCECCLKTDITLHHFNNMWMCDECKTKELALMPEVKIVNGVNNIIEKSRQIDASVEIKADLFNAETVASVELKSAIERDETIPADKKQYVYADESLTRYLQFKQAVFEMREEMNRKENAMRFWQVQARQAAATLHGEFREKFKALDINYQPVAPPKPKLPSASKPKTGTKKFKLEEIKKFAEQYGVPHTSVQLVATAKNLTAEEAAKYLSELMKPKQAE